MCITLSSLTINFVKSLLTHARARIAPEQPLTRCVVHVDSISCKDVSQGISEFCDPYARCVRSHPSAFASHVVGSKIPMICERAPTT